MGTLVTYRLRDSVATITMDDGKVNALSLAMLTELGAALDRAAADRAVVVLTGREGVFSAGFDLPVLRAGGTEAADLLHAGFDLAARLLAFPTLVLVACTGHAVAMGCSWCFPATTALREAIDADDAAYRAQLAVQPAG